MWVPSKCITLQCCSMAENIALHPGLWLQHRITSWYFNLTLPQSFNLTLPPNAMPLVTRYLQHAGSC